MAALGLESDDDAPTGAPEADTAPTPADSDATAVDAQAPATEADGTATLRKAKPAKRKGKAKNIKAAPAASEPKAATGDTPTGKATPRAGTKQALMIEMLKRPEGATVEQIAAATGWQHHTIRGAISGALKKKLGLTVEATRTREVGPNQTSAKGSSTVYRIVTRPGPGQALRRRGLAPGGNLFIAPTVALQNRGAATEPLPALDDHVDVLRIELDQAPLAPGLLVGDQGRP